MPQPSESTIWSLCGLAGPTGDPDLFAAIRRWGPGKVRVLRDDVQTRQLEQMAHLVAVGPAEHELLGLRPGRVPVVVKLAELPRLVQHLSDWVVRMPMRHHSNPLSCRWVDDFIGPRLAADVWDAQVEERVEQLGSERAPRAKV